MSRCLTCGASKDDHHEQVCWFVGRVRERHTTHEIVVASAQERFAPPRPCPFCGSRATPRRARRRCVGDAADPDAHVYYWRCLGCAAVGPWYKSRAAAAHAWSRRVP